MVKYLDLIDKISSYNISDITYITDAEVLQCFYMIQETTLLTEI